MNIFLIRSVKNHLPLQLSSRCSKPLSTSANKDFFGIVDVTSKDVAGILSGTRPDHKKLEQKYRALVIERKSLANEEVKHSVGYGQMRFDGENVPKQHGQYEPSNEKKMFETTDVKQIFVPYDIESKHREPFEENKELNSEAPTVGNPAYKVAEVSPELAFSEALKIFKKLEPIKEIEKYSNKPPLTFFFESDPNPTEQKPKEAGENEENLEKSSVHERDHSQHLAVANEVDKSNPESLVTEPNKFDSKEFIAAAKEIFKRRSKMVFEPDAEEPDIFSREYYDKHAEAMKDFEFDKTLDEKYDTKAKKAQPAKKAIDHLKNIRAQRVEPTVTKLKERIKNHEAYSFKPHIKLDSQGFNDYTHQVPNFFASRRVDVLKYIKSSIIYNNYDLIAVNKPYGISSHGGDRKELLDMNSLIEELAPQLRIEKVYLAHRLDKTTSGVLLFATSFQRAKQLNKLFKSDQIKKTYWCITKGVPDPEQAIIDIPIGEFTVDGKARSCVVPENIPDHKQLAKKFREARRAITEYQVLKSTRHSALVECKPRTGVKHQIRCHLGLGLNRPILGDHKYSNIGKLAPQTLPEPVLNAFHMRQQKVRTLPMHLHAKTIVIPGVKANGETLFIHAPLPLYFKQNLKTLKLMDDEIKLSADKGLY